MAFFFAVWPFSGLGIKFLAGGKVLPPSPILGSEEVVVGQRISVLSCSAPSTYAAQVIVLAMSPA